MNYETLKSILVLLALLIAGGIFTYRVYRLLWMNMRRGETSGPFGQWFERIKGLIVFVAGQQRLFRVPLPGIAHFSCSFP